MANNEVLAGLQRAYLASDNTNTKAHIRYTWRAETKQHSAAFSLVDADIRAWQPEQPDPLAELTRRVELVESQADRCVLNCEDRHGSLSERITSLERGLATLSNSVQTLDAAIDELNAPAQEQDDPVCARNGCGHKESDHIPAYDCGKRYPGECNECSCPAFLPAPPAAPLDPVLVDELEAFVNGWKNSFQFNSLAYIDKARVETVERLIHAYRKAVPS